MSHETILEKCKDACNESGSTKAFYSVIAHAWKNEIGIEVQPYQAMAAVVVVDAALDALDELKVERGIKKKKKKDGKEKNKRRF